MGGWLSKLFGFKKDETPVMRHPAAPPAAAPKVVTPTVNAPAARPAVAPVQRFGVRRPLVGRTGEIAGFEFRLARNLEQRLNTKPDLSVQTAYVVTLLSVMASTLEAGRLALTTMSAEVLLRPQVFDQIPSGLHVLVSPWECDNPDAPARIAALRARGVLIGRVAQDVPQPWPVDFVQLGVHDDDVVGFWAQLTDWRAQQPGMVLVTTDLAHMDDIERALQLGVALAGGRIEGGLLPLEREQRPLQTGTQRLCQLLNDVMQDGDTVAVAQDIRADVALSYKLLRFVNSPAVGLSRPVESVEQAVMVLGRNELYRWLSVLLLSAGEGRGSSKALHEIALARARLLEGLAEQRGDPVNHPPAALFTVGLLSLLDTLLQSPMAELLQPLRLSDAAKQALQGKTGPWANYLNLAIDLERHDMASATVHALEFGGVAQVLEVSDAAWGWAAGVRSSS
jgi:EAL and modified HD-GYP domain-containing signal transduction protein